MESGVAGRLAEAQFAGLVEKAVSRVGDKGSAGSRGQDCARRPWKGAVLRGPSEEDPRKETVSGAMARMARLSRELVLVNVLSTVVVSL